MSLAVVKTRALVGVHAPLVTVEAHLSNGLPGFTIVGLPETAVRESKDRVRSAILNSHFEFPQRKITVNLAPAELPKEGTRFDLAIALGILAASEQIPTDDLEHLEFIGELALSGDLRRIGGSIPAALASSEEKRALVVPKVCASELSLCRHADILCAGNLLQVCAHLFKRESLSKPQPQSVHTPIYSEDLNEVKGQHQARRALEIAAAGGHNLLFYGPPGTGKSMLASRLPTILPPLQESEALELAAVRSVAMQHNGVDWLKRPFRSPHHTSSAIALVGGGSNPKPGEISLAHRGVLFLDELPEYPRHVLEVLREPLESGQISIARASARVEFPAKFQLVAAMNPCPCGYFGDQSDRCRCTPNQISRYNDKISGPLLDRIDMQVAIQRLPSEALQREERSESSEQVRKRTEVARARQLDRQACSNADLKGATMKQACALDAAEQRLLSSAIEKLQFSARAHDRILKVARTIADLAESKTIQQNHLSEALSYRSFDRFYASLY